MSITSKYIEKADALVSKTEGINSNILELVEINKSNIQRLKI